MQNTWKDITDNLKLPPLKVGWHHSPEDGLCAMEMVSYIEREAHSDHPECTCPYLAVFVRRVNDMATDEYRQKLMPYLPQLVGTATPGHEVQRAEALTWLSIHEFVVKLYSEEPLSQLKGVKDLVFELKNTSNLGRASLICSLLKSTPHIPQLINSEESGLCVKLHLRRRLASQVTIAASCLSIAIQSKTLASQKNPCRDEDYRFMGQLNRSGFLIAAAIMEQTEDEDKWALVETALQAMLSIGPKSKGFKTPERVRGLAVVN